MSTWRCCCALMVCSMRCMGIQGTAHAYSWILRSPVRTYPILRRLLISSWQGVEWQLSGFSKKWSSIGVMSTVEKWEQGSMRLELSMLRPFYSRTCEIASTRTAYPSTLSAHLPPSKNTWPTACKGVFFDAEGEEQSPRPERSVVNGLSASLFTSLILVSFQLEQEKHWAIW